MFLSHQSISMVSDYWHRFPLCLASNLLTTDAAVGSYCSATGPQHLSPQLSTLLTTTDKSKNLTNLVMIAPLACLLVLLPALAALQVVPTGYFLETSCGGPQRIVAFPLGVCTHTSMKSNTSFAYSHVTKSDFVYVLNATQYSTSDCTDVGIANPNADLVALTDCLSPLALVGNGVVPDLPTLEPGFKRLM